MVNASFQSASACLGADSLSETTSSRVYFPCAIPIAAIHRVPDCSLDNAHTVLTLQAHPITIPMVVSVDPCDARSLLASWHGSRNQDHHSEGSVDENPAPRGASLDRIVGFARHLDEYLCAYEQYGVPVYHVNFDNTPEVLSAMHDHVLGKIQGFMADCLLVSKSIGDADSGHVT